MNVRLADIDEPQLERLFEQARRYPLLTAVQEREYDGRKWEAAWQARDVLLESPAGRVMLTAVARQRLGDPPAIEQFPQREHYFLLRRELGEDRISERHARALRHFITGLEQETGDVAAASEALGWSATLWTGIASSVLRRLGGRAACQVADALDAWAPYWQPPLAPTPPEPDTRQPLTRALHDFTCARDTLVLHNLRLVYTIAGRQLGRGVPLADLVQEGSLGLMRAAEKYEASKGYRFSTYCYNWISQAVRRAVGETGAIIRYPAHVREQVNRLHATREQLQYRHGIKPDERTLAEAAGIDLAKARKLGQLRNFSTSLDAPAHDDGESTVGEQLPDDVGEEISRSAELTSLHRCLLRELEQLDETERRIVLARWGLHDGPALSRGEVADQLSVSREWVRQLESSALQKLRSNTTLRKLFIDHAESF